MASFIHPEKNRIAIAIEMSIWTAIGGLLAIIVGLILIGKFL